ncbi:MAG: mechanosensitive ion channel family protein, partial [Bacteroidota bacterium]|nr:mechanosensitive ion channel family protein [Bacteroidota bacterium]
MKKSILFLILLVLSLAALSQQNKQTDSLHNDTVHLTEQLLLQQQQQKNVDELVKARLQNELQLLSADNKQKRELELQLHDIAVRDSIRKTEQKSKIELLRKTAKGYPVTLNEDTLFYVYTRLGSFNAAERAAAITARLEKLYADEFFNPDTLSLSESDNGYDIVYNSDLIVMSVSTTDALYFNKTPTELGTQYLQLIKQTVSKNKKSNSIINWIKRLGYVALVVIGIFVVIFFINRLFKLFSKRIIAKKDRYFKGITINQYKLFSPEQ